MKIGLIYMRIILKNNYEKYNLDKWLNDWSEKQFPIIIKN